MSSAASRSSSATLTVFQTMLDNIHNGVWTYGDEIPSERKLIEEYGVSRIAVREALSMLRGLGVLDVGHGRRTRVRKVDSETFGQLLPLLLLSGGQRTFEQVFEARLAVESFAAGLAAKRRTDEQVEKLHVLLKQFQEQIASRDPGYVQTDLDFHLQIASATGNPLFELMLEALARFISFAQRESCLDDPNRSRRALLAHEAIVEAIADSDSERARAEMEAHLRYSMTRRIDEKLPVPAESAENAAKRRSREKAQ